MEEVIFRKKHVSFLKTAIFLDKYIIGKGKTSAYIINGMDRPDAAALGASIYVPGGKKGAFAGAGCIAKIGGRPLINQWPGKRTSEA